MYYIDLNIRMDQYKAPKRKTKIILVSRKLSAAEQFLGPSVQGSTDVGHTAAKSKLSALQERIRAKSNGASGSAVFS